MKAKEAPKADVGVIVGRFHVDELHEAHKDLIQTVIDNHPKVIIFLGLSVTKCTMNNPLDFENRRKMMFETFPEIDNVVYINNQQCDDKWSKSLDAQIDSLTGPNQSTILYGGRDAFINVYSGRFKTQELQQTVFVSGKNIRKAISNKVISAVDFRKGIIWGTMNQWPKAIPTVDVAIFNDDYSQILLARKPTENLYRLVGGFVEPGEMWETAARREVNEETGLEITDPQYVCSAVIDDWRYRGEVDKITTTLFASKKVYGSPTPNDDICELKWFDVDVFLNISDLTNKFYEQNIVPEHRELIDKLRGFIFRNTEPITEMEGDNDEK